MIIYNPLRLQAEGVVVYYAALYNISNEKNIHRNLFPVCHGIYGDSGH
jgi:hypothetical protein